MNKRIINLCKHLLILSAIFDVGVAGAFGAQNARSASTTNSPAATSRGEGREVNRSGASATATGAAQSDSVSRAAVRRPTTTVSRNNATVVNSLPAVSGRSATRQNVVNVNSVRPGTSTAARSATTGVARSAVRNATTPARSASHTSTGASVSRAATARATAVFSDVSKIGGGYATCRDSYATCMDQFCANANDKYRRCFCSSKFTEFRDIENALDEAKTLLMRFEDNNLNAVDKTAAEVNAMYSATVGEMAIKNDTSGAASMLSEIGDLLSGKKKATPSTNSTTSLGIMDLDFSTDIGDIWGDSSASSSIFSSGTGQDLSTLEGQALFNAANKQCLSLMSDSCENDAVLSMAKSSYNILITQDCNAYEKKINSQKEAVQQTVRTAEKYLRDARLEEYRSHNSADVNECIAKVKSAITAETACGVNYKRCLDYTGAYIDSSTGDAIYSPRLFQLENLIKLDGENADVLQANPQFNNFLETRKMFATTALDSCRDISAIVWEEFKRSAIIEIAQAQDAKIEEVKMSCVSTMSECYDTQSSALKSFDNTTAQAAGALSAYAAKAMCQEKVTACAALYGNNSTCDFDDNGHLKSDPKACGLTALISFVDTVDTVRVAEGCAAAIDNYVQELCTPTTGTQGYPWNCRKKSLGDVAAETVSPNANASISENIRYFAMQNCSDPTQEKSYANLPLQTKTQVEKAINDIAEQLDYQLMDVCEDMDGYWLDAGDNTGTDLTAFYTTVYGSGGATDAANTWGRCVQNTTMIRCLAYNTDEETAIASYDRTKDECTFSDSWFKTQCSLMGNGYYENGVCYVAP